MESSSSNHNDKPKKGQRLELSKLIGLGNVKEIRVFGDHETDCGCSLQVKTQPVQCREITIIQHHGEAENGCHAVVDTQDNQQSIRYLLLTPLCEEALVDPSQLVLDLPSHFGQNAQTRETGRHGRIQSQVTGNDGRQTHRSADEMLDGQGLVPGPHVHEGYDKFCLGLGSANVLPELLSAAVIITFAGSDEACPLLGV